MRVVDLFSGCGGMSLGFQNAGFDIVAAFDNWEPAVNTYHKNFSHPVYKADLNEEAPIKQIEELQPDIIIGGTPCQDFSSAGHRDENLGRAALTYTYRDIVLRTKPKYFVMENVPRITKSKILEEIKNSFREVGYGLTEQVLDASYCGVPQSRKRFFLIGCLNEKDGFLQKELNENLADAPMTMRDYFGDSLGIDYYFRVPRSYNRRGVFSIDEPCQTIRGVDRPIPPGYPGHPSDPVAISPQVRALTTEERSYVQTFPRGFIFQGNKTDLNQMIGNAVPVKLAEYVAKALRAYDCKKSRKTSLGILDVEIEEKNPETELGREGQLRAEQKLITLIKEQGGEIRSNPYSLSDGTRIIRAGVTPSGLREISNDPLVRHVAPAAFFVADKL